MADSIDKQLAVADVYAEALFALAREAGTIEPIHAELEELAQLERQEPDFAAFMASSALDEDRRAASLEKMFRGKLSDETLNTLLVMNRHGRCGLLAVLLRRFVVREDEDANQVEVTATTATALSGEQQKSVAKIAAEVSGKTPLVEYVVDPAILGGLILQIGDLRYDNSIRRQLDVAHEQLRDRSERGLEVGVAD